MKQSGATSIVRRLMEETGLATPPRIRPRHEPVQRTARDHVLWLSTLGWTATTMIGVACLIGMSLRHGHLDLPITICTILSIAITRRFWRIIKEDLQHPTPNDHRFLR